MQNENTQIFVSHSVEETIEYARDFSQSLVGRETILLDGDLGAGKTHFTKGIALGLGISDVVTSPTFTLHNVYEDGRLILNHFDFYRIDDSEEVAVLGLDEFFSNNGAVAVIEWWQNVECLLPKKVIRVSIEKLSDNERKITIVK